jgi:hypothetical protein
MLTTSVRFVPDLAAMARMNTPTGIIGQGTRRAADITVARAKGSVNAYGRVKTGLMRNSIHATFTGSNQYECRFAISSAAPYAIFQHEGTSRGITPAPFLRNAIQRLRPGDFVL